MATYDLTTKLLSLSEVTAASGWIHTTAVDVTTILSRNAEQQTLLISNNHASNTVYVGFLSTMTSGAGWSYKLAAGGDKSIQIGPDIKVYALASAASSTITLVSGE